MRYLILILLMALSLSAQQTVNGSRDIRGRLDAGNAVSTRPAKTGASLPSTCVQGDLYFLTSASQGRKLHFCEATDTWVQTLAPGEGGGGDSWPRNRKVVAMLLPNGASAHNEIGGDWTLTGTATGISGDLTNGVGRRTQYATAATIGAQANAASNADYGFGAMQTLLTQKISIGSTSDVRAKIGWTNSGATSNHAGTDSETYKSIFFRYSTGASPADTTWQLCHVASGAMSCEDTSVTVTTGLFTLELVDGGTTVQAYINGSPVGTAINYTTAGLIGVAYRHFWVCEALTASSKTILLRSIHIEALN